MNLILTGAGLSESWLNLEVGYEAALHSVLRSYRYGYSNITLALAEHALHKSIYTCLVKHFPGINIKLVPKNGGALCTALLSLDYKSESGPIFITSADSFCKNGYETEVETFLASDFVAGTTILSQEDQSWSYVRKRGTELIEISEKRRISNFASTGFFMFRSMKAFLDGANWALCNAVKTNDKYYTSGSLQALLVLGEKVSAIEIADPNSFISLRSDEDVDTLWKGNISHGS
jgi:hypothetical protein